MILISKCLVEGGFLQKGCEVDEPVYPTSVVSGGDDGVSMVPQCLVNDMRCPSTIPYVSRQFGVTSNVFFRKCHEGSYPSLCRRKGSVTKCLKKLIYYLLM